MILLLNIVLWVDVAQGGSNDNETTMRFKTTVETAFQVKTSKFSTENWLFSVISLTKLCGFYEGKLERNRKPYDSTF